MGLNSWARFKNAAVASPPTGGMRRGEHRVAGFSGGQQMADRADAADARHQRGHFIKGPSFAEFLKSPKLRDMKMRVRNFALIVDLQRDLAVAFDARNWIDCRSSWTFIFLFCRKTQIQLSTRSGSSSAKSGYARSGKQLADRQRKLYRRRVGSREQTHPHPPLRAPVESAARVRARL